MNVNAGPYGVASANLRIRRTSEASGGLNLGGRHTRSIHGIGDIDAQIAPLDGMFEGLAQHHVDVANAPSRHTLVK